MKVLLIDTHSSEEVSVGLKIEDKKEFLQSKTLNSKEHVLPIISEILKKHRLKPDDLDGIKVAVGPGSFTGLRVGVAIANTLGWLLGISINQKKIGETVEPVYFLARRPQALPGDEAQKTNSPKAKPRIPRALPVVVHQ